MERVPCIRYPVRVRKDRDEARTVTIAMTVSMASTVTIAMTVSISSMVTMAITSFSLQDKRGDCRHTVCRGRARREDLPGCRQPTYDKALWSMWYTSGAWSWRARMSLSWSPPSIRITPTSPLPTPLELLEYTGINNHPIEMTF